MASLFADSDIGQYLRERLMPVEGAIPHLDGIEMYGNSIPAGTAGGDLFEYINFQQRHDIDARIRRALRLSKEYLRPQGERAGRPLMLGSGSLGKLKQPSKPSLMNLSVEEENLAAIPFAVLERRVGKRMGKIEINGAKTLPDGTKVRVVWQVQGNARS